MINGPGEFGPDEKIWKNGLLKLDTNILISDFESLSEKLYKI